MLEAVILVDVVLPCSGVPQGGVLGLILFIINFNVQYLAMYANDTRGGSK